MLLKDKVIIISGVGLGMGQNMAKIAAAEGAKVGLGARNQDYLDKVAKEITKAGGEALAFSTDVTDAAQCKVLANAVQDKFGRIDGLVNSAYNHGSWATADVADAEEWAAIYDVNCLGALRMGQAVLPAMKEQGSGAIVNVSTMATVNPFPGEAAYAASKGGLGVLTNGLDWRRARHGIYRRPSRSRPSTRRGCRRNYGSYSARYYPVRRRLCQSRPLFRV